MESHATSIPDQPEDLETTPAMTRLTLFATACLVCFASAAHADTLINLNATGVTTNNPAYFDTLSLAAGTYSVSAIDNTANGGYMGWNQADNPSTNNEWEERVGLNLTGSTFSTNPEIYPYPNSDPQFFIGLFDNAADALSAAQPATFTLASTQNVTFYIPDVPSNGSPFNEFWDNTGGVSLDVTAVTPEPSSLMLLGTGALGLAGAIRRRRFQAK